MEFWDDLSGGIKALIVVGVLAAIGLTVCSRTPEPTPSEVEANRAARSVKNQ